MKESGLDIKTHYFKVVMICIGQENSYAAKLHHRCIRCTIVLRSLAKTLSHKPRLFFTSYNGSIWVIFVVECPADTDSFTARWQSRAFKCLALFETVQFPLHGRKPGRIIRSCSGFMVGVGRLR